MADTATTRKRLRKQSLGSNVNTWGDTKLNEAFDVIDQSMDGYLAITLTGDLTLTTTNYDTADQAKRRIHKFTGALVSSASVTYPSVEGWYFVINTSGAQVTVKCSGGTGVAVPNGRSVLVYGDGTDLYAMVPNYLPTALAALSNANDFPTYSQVQTLIANAALPASAGSVLNSAADTTAGYLLQKLNVSAAGAVSGAWTTENPGADENALLTITVATHALTAGGLKTAGFTAAVNTKYTCVFGAGGTITFPAAATQGDIIETALAGNYIYTIDPNGLRINSSTSTYVMPGNQTYAWTYMGATDGWV